MARIEDIPFRKIPHQSSLFLNYIESAPQALRFYAKEPTLDNLVRGAKALPDSFEFPRAQMAAILRRQNEGFGGGMETERNIDDLKAADCVAVLTGQQVGLFTGPIYTIYKALTAIRIAEELNARGVRAVPVFWMETEDHDLAEATQRALLTGDHTLRVTDYQDMLFRDSGVPQGSVGCMRFPANIRLVVQDYMSHLADTEWKQEIRCQLESTYKPGATFTQSFGRLLSLILRGSGMIVFDPQDPAAKELAKNIFIKALCDTDAIREGLLQRNQELRSSEFHAQVSVLEGSTTLFYFQDGARHALEARESGFSLKNAGHHFSLDALLDCVQKSPEKFSPNVLLRPIVQDHLFPTIAYVGGSAEVAYFAQIEVLYRLWSRPMPVIWPRNSFTLVGPEISAQLDALKIEVQDCFHGRQPLIEKALHRSGLSEAARGLEEFRRHMDQEFTRIKPGIEAVDPTLATALETARRKILHNVQRMKSHVLRLEAAKGSLASNTLDLLMNHCYPSQKLQERELGIQHFWIRHGPFVLDAVRSSLDIERFSHRVLHLP